MSNKKVTFFAVKYRDKPIEVKFYTKEGKSVHFGAVQKVPRKEKVEFYVSPHKGRKK